MTITERVKNAWNVFRNRNPSYVDSGPGYYRKPDRIGLSGSKDRSIVNSILTRIAIDAASVKMNHVLVDDDERFVKIIDSELNERLNLEANIDETGRAFIQNAVLTMLDVGVVALLPVDLTINDVTQAKTIKSIRVGRVTQWYPQKVRVEAYNDRTGRKQEVIVDKTNVALIENPFYSMMNAPNSMLRRLSLKLALLDAVDEHNSSGKLDLIISLPYAVHGELKERQAEARKKKIEDQLVGSKYGIAYVDGTEHITQLNRPVENNLMNQIEFLTTTVYSQLGITTGILDGTANEETMTNYYSRVIEPILSAIADELVRKFLTATARSQHQTIMYFRDPFKLIPITKVADIGDKMKRNEILSSNELRQILGRKPSTDENANKLINSNIRQRENSETTDDTKLDNNKEVSLNGL